MRLLRRQDAERLGGRPPPAPHHCKVQSGRDGGAQLGFDSALPSMGCETGANKSGVELRAILCIRFFPRLSRISAIAARLHGSSGGSHASKRGRQRGCRAGGPAGPPVVPEPRGLISTAAIEN